MLVESISINMCLSSGFPDGADGKELDYQHWRRKVIQVQSLSGEYPLEKGTATHSSIPTWRIPQTEDPGGLQTIGLQNIRHDWSNWAHTHTHTPRMFTLPTWNMCCFLICFCFYSNVKFLIRFTAKSWHHTHFILLDFFPIVIIIF